MAPKTPPKSRVTVSKSNAKPAPRTQAGAKGPASQADALTSADCESAFRGFAGRLKGLDARAVVSPSFNPQTAAPVVLAAVRYIESSGLRPQLEKLAKAGLFELRHLTELRALAQAGWFVRTQLDAARAAATSERLPAQLVADSTELRARMLRVLEYHFADDPDVAPRLAFIRQGAGYQDLAADLIELAKLYKQHRATLDGTPRFYRAGDEAEAARKADQILEQLDGKSSHAAKLQDDQARIAMLLDESYEEVRQAALFLTRRDPAAAEMLPSLSYASRRASARAKSEPAPAPAPASGRKPAPAPAP